MEQEAHQPGSKPIHTRGDLTQARWARSCWPRLALSPWVGRCLSGWGVPWPVSAGSTGPIALSMRHTQAIVQRAERKKDGGRVWQPEEGALAPVNFFDFAQEIAQRYQPVTDKYQVQTAEVSPNQEGELPLAPLRALGRALAWKGAWPQVQGALAALPSSGSVQRAPVSPRPSALSAPPLERLAIRAQESRYQPRRDARPVSRVEEIGPGPAPRPSPASERVDVAAGSPPQVEKDVSEETLPAAHEIPGAEKTVEGTLPAAQVKAALPESPQPGERPPSVLRPSQPAAPKPEPPSAEGPPQGERLPLVAPDSKRLMPNLVGPEGAQYGTPGPEVETESSRPSRPEKPMREPATVAIQRQAERRPEEEDLAEVEPPAERGPEEEGLAEVEPAVAASEELAASFGVAVPTRAGRERRPSGAETQAGPFPDRGPEAVPPAAQLPLQRQIVPHLPPVDEPRGGLEEEILARWQPRGASLPLAEPAWPPGASHTEAGLPTPGELTPPGEISSYLSQTDPLGRVKQWRPPTPSLGALSEGAQAVGGAYPFPVGELPLPALPTSISGEKLGEGAAGLTPGLPTGLGAIQGIRAAAEDLWTAGGGQSEEKAAIDLDNLARQVYPVVKRMLAVERERRSAPW